VIEDYVHHEGLKVASIMLAKFTAILLGFGAVFAVLSVYFRG